jgi:dTDP-4-amino-4,6-dideoxygalactose transaminase
VFALAKECGAVVVEDAAQAHGATFEGRPVGALGRAGGFSLQSSKNLSAGEGGVFVTNDDDAWELANRVRNFGQDLKRTDAEHYDLARPLDGHRSLQSIHMGSMYRGNELMAAIARAQLQELGARTRAAQDHAARLSERLAKLPGVHPPRTFASCTSVHHKYRVRFDLAEAGLSGTGVAERTFRDALSLALRREGLEVVLWQDQPLAEMDVFQTRRGFGDGFPFRLADPKRLEANYAKGAYPRTRRLLDSSLLLFSQSFPLIAQDETLVDRYAEAFERVWNARQRIAADAERIVRDARAAA